MKYPSITLTTQQLHLLKIIYKFRFVTADLAAQYKSVSTRATNESLSILLKKELISRRYNTSYKLLGKAARYYLAPRALKQLQGEKGLQQNVLHSRYKDKTVSEEFVDHSLSIFQLCLDIRSQYQATFTIATKAELAGRNDFLQPLPDLYLSRNDSSNTLPDDYMIDIMTDTQYFLIKKRVDQYIEHFESGDWGNSSYPKVLLVCSTKVIIRKLTAYIEDSLDSKYIDDSAITIQAIQSLGDL
jgi:hypothetical protein